MSPIPPPYDEAPTEKSPSRLGYNSSQTYDQSSRLSPQEENGPNGSGEASTTTQRRQMSIPFLSVDEHYDSTSRLLSDANIDGELPPPPYSEVYGRIEDDRDLGANATVCHDGRVDIRISEKSNRLSRIFLPALRDLDQAPEEPAPPPPYIPPSLGGSPGQEPPPSLNVVIHVVGSRGDVQPFLALGKVLKETYGHRVRLATHPVFQKFIEENGLEFFSIGGDPAELMSFMVKNPGLMPGRDALRSGEISRRRKAIGVMIRGCWRSCFETGNGLQEPVSNNNVEEWLNSEENPLASSDTTALRPFVADAIIANPPSFAHIHCAEKLGIPLHMMFTMPWSPTQSFPHPLANIQSSNADTTLSNWMSYIMVDMLTWQGLGDVINRFRRESLGLDAVGLMYGPGMLHRLRIPFTYCWSPTLIPKCKDWKHHINISGFYFLSLASKYTPDQELQAFLDAGPSPVYIGFGSIVVDDPNAMTQLIFDAVKRTGQRTLVSKGWGGLGSDEMEIPENVYMLGNVPHDFLFQRVSCVVHHGGAGTTAAGIAAGKPTVIVPFFGDQPFWGSMVARAGAGPEPIPHKKLTSENLADAILQALQPSSQDKAKELSQKISQEQGNHKGAQFFHQMLKLDQIRCALAPGHTAVWRIRRTKIRLSALAATVLLSEGELEPGDLKLYRPREYELDGGAIDPISGGASAVLGVTAEVMMGVADYPIGALKGLGLRPGPKKDNTSGSKTSSSAITSKNGQATQSMPDLQDRGLTPPGSETTSLHNADTSSETRSQSRSGLSADTASQQTSQSASLPTSPCSCNSSTVCKQHSQTDGDHIDRLAAARDTSKGIARILGASLRSPVDVTMAISRGFHNTPKLYGQEVRQVEKVTGFSSGMRVAAKEFGYGLYDGITGLVKDPYNGAKQQGGYGFIKGLGTGLAGVTVKSGAGVFAIPAYGMQGIYKQLQRPYGSGIHDYILASRAAQGHHEYSICSAQKINDILQRWRCLQTSIKSKKKYHQRQMDSLLNRFEARKKGLHSSSLSLYNDSSTSISGSLHGNRSTSSLPQSSESNIRTPSGSTPSNSRGFSIQRRPVPAHGHQAASEPWTGSTAQTTTCDDNEERFLQQIPGISGLVGYRLHGELADEEDAELERALQASLAEASTNGATEEDQHNLEEALRRSIIEQRHQDSSGSDWDATDSDTGDDENFHLAIQESLRADEASTCAEMTSEEEELRKAMEASQREELEREKEEERRIAEEKIVMEYVKKQSLAEEEHKRRMLTGQSLEFGYNPGEGSQPGPSGNH